MKYSQAKQGRIFIMRLEDGETVHEEIEKFASAQSIRTAALIILGGADENSKLVVGPADGRATPVDPMEHVIDNVHEVTGTGTLFPDEDGNPMLHMHMACGRNTETVTGCIRQGVKVWKIMEVIIFELLDTKSMRVVDGSLGFKLLEP